MIELPNTPVPVPLLVFVDSEIVGLIDVDQQTPLDVTIEPPSDVTLPPPDDVDDVIDVIGVVVTTGCERVLNVTCAPYDVPDVFVA